VYCTVYRLLDRCCCNPKCLCEALHVECHSIGCLLLLLLCCCCSTRVVVVGWLVGCWMAVLLPCAAAASSSSLMLKDFYHFGSTFCLLDPSFLFCFPSSIDEHSCKP
jgi:hypothetical protein